MKHTAARTHPGPRATAPSHAPSRTPRRGRRGARALPRAHGTFARFTTRIQAGLEEAARRPDRGDISTTTVIIWVAAVTGAVLIAGTIAVVIAKYNGKLAGL
ncbi:hypothetical protein ACIRPX_43615 [Streptomyces sp. NPDC101225]|uniref:hypothetical protein n=1 Tax=Streptomyces sp. NPDC101225 TaxID=3366135 RepID=UPI00380D2333